jgi:RHS repeat-associated protein
MVSVGNLAGITVHIQEEVNFNVSFDKLQHCILKDAAPGFEEQGYTPPPVYEALEICGSDDPDFEYMAHSPYYKGYFRGDTVRMSVGDAWVEIELAGFGTEKGEPGKKNQGKMYVDMNVLCVSDIFESVDLSFKVDTSLLAGMFVLKELQPIERVILNMSCEGVAPVLQEDGSILFLHEEGKGIVKILTPFMKDAEGSVCTDIHYELVETETGYELHKIIDEKGLKWLKEAVYPVVVDPSMQTLEDAWESSGLTPYGQYFENLQEYVNPSNGHLTVTQTDLVIPGRGLDLVISRVYETPAVFYGENPYSGEYEAPPVNVGKGWQLNFPFIGDAYVHLWGGTVHRITWVENIFENHTGSHFILVRNGDSTYTLTTADGIVYEFSSGGKLTSIKDLDENVITFTYTSGILTSITDTIGRSVTLSYSNNQLWKIIYNGAEIEYSYDVHGCLVWMEDFLNRRTSYYYDTGYNNWLLSKIVYPTSGYTTYAYNRFTDKDYYKYCVTNQRVYETDQVRHCSFLYTGSFSEITGVTMTVKNESDIIQGSNQFIITDGLITEKTIKNASGAAIRKYTYAYNSRKEVTEEDVYHDGSHLSYTNYCAYDNWGNTIYIKNAEGHEQFFSYANTNTSRFFVENTGSVIQKFTNAFANSAVPSSVHTALLGAAEKQDNTNVKEVYLTYDGKAHPIQSENAFGNTTSYLTFFGTFNEKTGQVSFPIDLTDYTVTGNGILEITGLPSDDIYHEHHSYTPSYGDFCFDATWMYCSWQSKYFKVYNIYTCGRYPEIDIYEGWKSLGPFTHYPGTIGYVSYSAPFCNQQSHTFTVTTNWKAYPVQTKYNLDQTTWKEISSNVQNTTAQVTVPITDGSHTLYFSESSLQNTRFSWTLYVPVDNTPDTYITSMTYDTYGNVTSVTDAESNTVTFSYSPDYSYAYVTEISATAGNDIIITKATYDYDRGWITSIQEPKGVAGSGYDYLYTYDVLGRIIKKEFPLLPGQSQRSCMEAVYDCEHGTITVINQLGQYFVREHDNLGRLTAVKLFTGEFGYGTLYATTSYTYSYSDQVLTVTDPQNHTTMYTYDFLGRITDVLSSDSSAVFFSYDDTNNRMVSTDGRGYDRICWFDWLSRLTKVEEEYSTGLFAATSYQYDEVSHLVSFTDAESHTTQYTYGSVFGLTQITYPDSTYEAYTYDNVGNTTVYIDAEGNETQFLYDTLCRLTQIQYDQSTVSFAYDLNSNKTRMDDHSPHQGDYIEYQYDCWNRLVTETRHILTDTYTVSYQYDTANRLTTLIYPDTTQILYSYDDLNRTTEISRYRDGITNEILLDHILYNTESQLTQFSNGNGLQTTFTYDSRDRLSTLDVKNGATPYLDLDYMYDSNSNITQIGNGWRNTTSDWHTQTESYSYDGLDRLTSANSLSWSHTYAYDKAGNRTAKDGITSTINVVNEVTALSDGTTFSYDSKGNRTQRTKGPNTWVYTYDYANRLTKVEKNSATLGEYVYDGEGRRIQVTEDNETTTYIYSGLNVLYEETMTGTAVYIYGPAGLLAKKTETAGESHTFYYHTDHLGSTRLVTDESNTIVTSVTYHPFGEPILTGEESHLYTGKEIDATGLYYYGARYYDPDLGRFMTRDLLAGKKAVPQSLNLYSYCLNNPVKMIDPAGLYALCNVGTGICTEIYAGGSKWSAYDERGQKITDSEEISNLLEKGTQESLLEATELLLMVLGYSEENHGIEIVNDHIEMTVGGVTVKVYPLFDNRDEFGYHGHTYWREEKKRKWIDVYILVGKRAPPHALLHMLGHEMVHVHQHTSGDFQGWVDEYGEDKAKALADIEATIWNIDHVMIFPFPREAFRSYFEKACLCLFTGTC